MNPTTAFPNPNREPARTVAGKWPVIARLPDVADGVPTRSPLSRALANADVHDYRFDPPQARSLYHPHDTDHITRASRRPSPVLPHSDPFAIRGASTLEKLGPVLRILLLIALFTAAGMILLAGGNDPKPQVQNNVTVKSTVTRQTLEPAGAVVETLTSAPTAAGPAPLPKDAANQTAAHVPDGPELNDPADKPVPDDLQALGGAAESAAHPYPETAWPAAAMPDAGQSALPQVQTTDPPQAVAQLPGFITEIPQRHASHDDNQPGLH